MIDLPSQSSADSDTHSTGAETSAQPISVPTISEEKAEVGSVNQQSVAADSLFHQLSRMLSEPTPEQINLIKPIALAYLGDAVFELYVRSQLLHPPKRIRHYHRQVVSKVNAESQANYVDALLEHLTEAEKDLLRRGRNATTGKNRRAKGQDYQKATGLEALIGFLYLSDLPRLLELLSHLDISAEGNLAGQESTR